MNIIWQFIELLFDSFLILLIGIVVVGVAMMVGVTQFILWTLGIVALMASAIYMEIKIDAAKERKKKKLEDAIAHYDEWFRNNS